MLTTTLRPLTESEKQLLAQRFPNWRVHWEQRILNFVVLLGLLLLPLLLVKRFCSFASTVEVAYCVIAVLIATGATWHISRREQIELRNSLPLPEGLIQEVHVRCHRAIRREDPKDFGVAYYLDVSIDGTPRILYLWGQYLDELEHDGCFPNTNFTYSHLPGSSEFLSFEVLGQYFQPEETLPPFSKEIWQNGSYPLNGQILREPYESLS